MAGAQGVGTEIKMQHLAFKGALMHWERQAREQMKTVSCRDEGLDLGAEGSERAVSRWPVQWLVPCTQTKPTVP